MRIGELAEHTGVSRETLRYYESLGLIQARRLANGYRDYPDAAATLVIYIRRAQQLGFGLAEIGEHLPQIWQAAQPEQQIAAVLAGKLGEIDQRIADLQQLRNQLAQQLGLVCPLRQQAQLRSASADTS